MWVTHRNKTSDIQPAALELGLTHVDTAKKPEKQDVMESVKGKAKALLRPLLRTLGAATFASIVALQMGFAAAPVTHGLPVPGHPPIHAVAVHGVTLSWTVPTMNTDGSPIRETLGYKIYRFHPTSRAVPGAQPAEVRDVGSLPSVDSGNGNRTITYRWNGLPQGETDYWTVTAYVRHGTTIEESAYSGEVSGVVK